MACERLRPDSTNAMNCNAKDAPKSDRQTDQNQKGRVAEKSQRLGSE
jgi:hypothetical protein